MTSLIAAGSTSLAMGPNSSAAEPLGFHRPSSSNTRVLYRLTGTCGSNCNFLDLQAYELLHGPEITVRDLAEVADARVFIRDRELPIWAAIVLRALLAGADGARLGRSAAPRNAR